MKYAFIAMKIIFIFFVHEIHGENLPVFEMDTITVTANRTVSSGDETGTFQVISHEMIREGNYKNVSEVLRTIPGIYFATESFLGNLCTESNTGPKIRIRGKGAKLLIDGRPMNMAIFGCLINNMLTLDHVERIEVTRGSESVLYGSDGLGGVINIITRDPGELGAGISIRGGGKSTVISSLEHENMIGPFGYFLSGSLKRSDGYRGDADFADESGFLKMTYDITESMKIESSLNMYRSKSNDPGTVLDPKTDFWADIKRRQMDITLKKWGKTATYSIKAFHNEGHHIFEEQDGWHSRDTTDGFRADMVKTFSGGANRLIVGTDGRWIGGKTLTDFNWFNNNKWYRENETAVFASDRHILMDGRLSLIGGARLVRNSAFGTFFCPKAGAAFNIENTRLHAGYNRAFKSPPLLQIHLHKKSNPELNPEIADHFEIGADHTLSDVLSVSGTLFYIDGTDQVEKEYDDDGNLQGFKNTGKWEHRGCEITANWVPASRLSISAGYTYMDVGSNTQYNPKHQGNLNVRTTWTLLQRELSLNLNGLGISEIFAANESRDRLDDYIVIDLYADWKVHKNGSVIIGVNNLLDKEYAAVKGYPLPGSVITAGIRLER